MTGKILMTVTALGAIAVAAIFLGRGSDTEVGVIGGGDRVSAQGAALSGKIEIDGSSTVAPLSEAIGEEFGKAHRDVKVTVGTSGTGGGFKKFARGDTDVSDASRPIKSSEADACKLGGVSYMGIPVAVDALTVAVNKDNTWAGEMTVEELKKMWEPAAEGKVMLWSDVRDGWPKEKIVLYGAGTDSGTFDYFTEAICGKGGSSRKDYTATEDDHVTIKGLEGSKYAIGYFGFSYLQQHKDKLKAVSIKNTGADKFIAPSEESVLGGTYKPLARPIFIYVKMSSLDRPEVAKFVEYYLDNCVRLAKKVGMVALPEKVLKACKTRFEDREESDKDIYYSVMKKEAEEKAKAEAEAAKKAEADKAKSAK